MSKSETTCQYDDDSDRASLLRATFIRESNCERSFLLFFYDIQRKYDCLFFFFLFYTDAQCLRSTKNIVRQALQQANLVSFFEQASGVFTLLQSAGPVGSTC